MAKRYAVCDGKLVLMLEEDEDGWYVVTSPMDPEVVTQAKSISDAFMMARDAIKTLAECRAKPFKPKPLARARRGHREA